jgi:hypothetical protein
MAVSEEQLGQLGGAIGSIEEGEKERGLRGIYRRRRAIELGRDLSELKERKFRPARLSPPVIAAGGWGQ